MTDTTLSSSSLVITPLTASIGAVVEGVDLRALDDDAFEGIHRALLDHLVLFFPRQRLQDDEQLALCVRWGPPMRYPIAQILGLDSSALGRIEDTADSPPDVDNWHTDITWWPQPPKVAILRAVDIPPAGGDTMWASLYAAHDALSPAMQRICASLDVVHTPGDRFLAVQRRIFGDEVADRVAEHCGGAVQPLVRIHDETGRPALFVSGFMDQVVGMHRAESDLLLEYLQALLHDPNRQVRWRWSPGDVAIWDERCTNHRALSDHFPQHRLMVRCTAEGSRPVGPAGSGVA